MEDKQDKLLNSIMVSFVAQMDAAMETSKKISEHSKEEELSPDSFLSGLVYRLMTPMTDDELKTSMDKANEIISAEDSEETDDEEEYEFGKGLYSPISQDYGDQVIVSRVVKRNDCNCSFCIRVRKCLDDYKSHETDDQLAQMFKDAIDNTCDIHNISI